MAENPEPKYEHSKVKNLREGIRKAFETGFLADCRFTYRGEQFFKAHKLILAARSSSFSYLLGPNEYDPIFIEEPVTGTGFEILLRFIYLDEIGTEEKFQVIEAYIAANCYRQRALQEACKSKIESWMITLEEVWQLLNAGLTVPPLKDKCLSFIESKEDNAVLLPAFLDINLDCLNAVLDSKVLKNVPVLQRLDRIMEWATKHYQPEYIPKDNEENGLLKYIRKEFEKNGLLGKLEIDKLKLEELRSIQIKYPGLIAPQEFVNLVVYTGVRETSSLPSWCIPSS